MWLKLPLMSCLLHISINEQSPVVDLAWCVVYIQSIQSFNVNTLTTRGVHSRPSYSMLRAQATS